MLALASESERLARMGRHLVDTESLASPATHGLAMVTVALLAQVMSEIDEHSTGPSSAPNARAAEMDTEEARVQACCSERDAGDPCAQPLGEIAITTGAGDFSLWSTKTDHHGHACLTVVGELGCESVALFSWVVSGLVRSGARRVTIDLSHATVTENAGLWALETERMSLIARHGELVLRSPRSGTLALLKRFGLGYAFSIC